MRKKLESKCMVIVGLLMAMTGQVYAEHQKCETGLRAELLYWKSEMHGLEDYFGSLSKDVTVNGGVTTTAFRESDEKPDGKWSAGLRVGAGITSHRCDIGLDWTHFNGRAHFDDDESEDEESNGNWKVRYNALDLVVGHNFSVTHRLDLRPFIGLRYANIHHRLRSFYNIVTTGTAPDITSVQQHNKEQFSGIGPEVGVSANWCVTPNFSVYGSLDIVSYFGKGSTKFSEIDTNTTTVTSRNTKTNHCFDNLATDIAIGVCWNRAFTCDKGCKVDLMLKLGLEQHRLYELSDFGSTGTITMSGGILAAGVNFRY